MNIEKLAEELYPMEMTGGGITKSTRQFQQNAFIKGYQSCETRSKKIVEALKECVEVMKVLEDHGILKAVEKDNAYDKAKQALTDYEGENE